MESKEKKSFLMYLINFIWWTRGFWVVAAFILIVMGVISFRPGANTLWSDSNSFTRELEGNIDLAWTKEKITTEKAKEMKDALIGIRGEFEKCCRDEVLVERESEKLIEALFQAWIGISVYLVLAISRWFYFKKKRKEGEK